MSLITLQLDRDLIEKVKEIAQNKFSLRKINSYAEATREALIEFVKKNQKHSKKPTPQTQIETVQEESI